VLALSSTMPLEGMTANFADPRTRQMINGSTYLKNILGDAAHVRNDLGVNLVSQGRFGEAIDQFEEALRLQPDLAVARRNLTAAQQAQGRSSGGAAR
jgi:Flp pilus assembly protein TadD